MEWKVSEMKKLLLSQDMDVRSCHFREEQAFLSALPLVSMEKGLFERGKRNLLTGGAASCYPFTSFEMCDDNGILLGVNKYNSCFDFQADVLRRYCGSRVRFQTIDFFKFERRFFP